MDESEYWEQVESDLRGLSQVESVKRTDGERDYIAGQRDISRTEYRLTLVSDVVSTIEAEREESVDELSETLESLLNQLEHQLGVVPGDYEEGAIYVTAEYDNYPGGSL